MSERHELPDGGWVELRDPRSVTYRQRKPLVLPYERLAQAFRDAATPTEMPASPKPGKKAPEPVVRIEVNEAIIDDSESVTVALALALVESWSFGDPPKTADDVLDLPAVTLDALDAILTDELPKLFLDRSPSTDDKSPMQP